MGKYSGPSPGVLVNDLILCMAGASMEFITAAGSLKDGDQRGLQNIGFAFRGLYLQLFQMMHFICQK